LTFGYQSGNKQQVKKFWKSFLKNSLQSIAFLNFLTTFIPGKPQSTGKKIGGDGFMAKRTQPL